MYIYIYIYIYIYVYIYIYIYIYTYEFPRKKGFSFKQLRQSSIIPSNTLHDQKRY